MRREKERCGCSVWVCENNCIWKITCFAINCCILCQFFLRESVEYRPKTEEIWYDDVSFTLEHEGPWLKSWFCHSLLLKVWLNHLTSVCLNFLIYTVGNESSFLLLLPVFIAAQEFLIPFPFSKLGSLGMCIQNSGRIIMFQNMVLKYLSGEIRWVHDKKKKKIPWANCLCLRNSQCRIST